MRRLLILLAFLFSVGAAGAEDIITLATRNGVTQSYLLSAPESGKAQAVAVLFPGGEGKIDLERETARKSLDGDNFLVRSRRLFAENGIAAAVVDVPSDHASGMDDQFRLGSAHAEDAAKVIADLKTRFPGLPVFLVGTSRGTVSTASIARRAGPAVDGVVLTATLFLANKRESGLSGFDFSAISSPLLFVHHVDDRCNVTPYSSAKRMAERYPLVSVSGGNPPQSSPCQPMSQHGFLGREAQTVDAISKWILKQPQPREIN
jgi:pimeloyl-ACP methyl ester carboxylesterase